MRAAGNYKPNRTSPILAFVAALGLGLGACKEGPVDHTAPAAKRVQQDPSPASERDAGRVDIAIPWENLSPENPERLKQWRQSSDFEVSYGDRGCNKDCPVYFLSLDQTGHFRFNGHSHVARQGRYTIDVGVPQTRALYLQLLDLGILRLDRRLYAGAVEQPTDERDVTIIVSNGKEPQAIQYFGGLIAGPGGDALRDIIRVITSWRPPQRFISPGRELCYEVDNRFEKLVIESVKTSYVILSNEGAVIGTLGFVEPPTELLARAEGYAVQVSNCQGEELFVTTEVSVDGCGFAVVPEAPATTFSFPGVDYAVNAALLGVEKDSTDADAESGEWTVHLLDADSDTKLRVRASDALSCD
jgi:hypothetical protein